MTGEANAKTRTPFHRLPPAKKPCLLPLSTVPGPHSNLPPGQCPKCIFGFSQLPSGPTSPIISLLLLSLSKYLPDYWTLLTSSPPPKKPLTNISSVYLGKDDFHNHELPGRTSWATLLLCPLVCPQISQCQQDICCCSAQEIR